MESLRAGSLLVPLSSSPQLPPVCHPSTHSQFQTCVNFSLPLYYHLIYRILRFVTWKGVRNSHLQFCFSNIPSLLVKITLLTASNLLQFMRAEGTRARETAQLAEVVWPLDPCDFLLTLSNTGAVFRVRRRPRVALNNLPPSLGPHLLPPPLLLKDSFRSSSPISWTLVRD